jgi:serine/threonine protein kinase
MALQQGMVISGRYEIITPIKSGGMGAVYRAFDLHFHKREVALKEMLQEFSSEETAELVRRKFEEEAEILVNLSHHGIPRVLDHFIEKDVCYIVMDFIDGVSLDRLLEEYLVLTGKPVRQDFVAHYAIQICEILEYLHGQKPMPIVHRDIKPGNIILRKLKQEVILVDFGLARTINPDSVSEKTLVGTMGYAPLEQFKGLPEPRSDIYALGATMHHLISGAKPAPFSLEPLENVFERANRELAAIVNRATSESLEGRFQSAAEMKKALQDVHPRLVDSEGERTEVTPEEKTKIAAKQASTASMTERETGIQPAATEYAPRKTSIEGGRLTRIEHIVADDEKIAPLPIWKRRNALALVVLIISMLVFICFLCFGSRAAKIERYMMFNDAEAARKVFALADLKGQPVIDGSGIPQVMMGEGSSDAPFPTGFIFKRLDKGKFPLPLTISAELKLNGGAECLFFCGQWGALFQDANGVKGYSIKIVKVTALKGGQQGLINLIKYPETIMGPFFFKYNGEFERYGLRISDDNNMPGSVQIELQRLALPWPDAGPKRMSRNAEEPDYFGILLTGKERREERARVYIRDLNLENK